MTHAFRGDTGRYKDVTNRPVAAPTFTINRHNTWHRQHALSTTTGMLTASNAVFLSIGSAGDATNRFATSL